MFTASQIAKKLRDNNVGQNNFKNRLLLFF